MIDNQIYISSTVLISDIYNEYNIQSDDFVSRLPIWVANALEELNFIQAYITKEKDIEFDDNRCQLPWDFKGLIDLIINNQKAVLKNSAYFNKDAISQKVNTVETYTPYTEDETNVEFTYSNGTKIYKEDSIKPNDPYYYISNNWIHTNINNGLIHIIYKALPVVFDSNINMDVPLIYNDGLLKRYLKLYCLKQMLLRGLKHPVLSLNNNNIYTNPALELDKIRISTRVSCNKFNHDRRENIASILRTI